MSWNAEALLNSYSEMIPSKRVGTPEEITKGIAWLLSDKASFVTGTTLTIDGGTSAG
ncbi:SDR family oxidoreductase [Bacillus cabrialesii]|uniref:SDR family oxidoreductase n=1 Tax=Bacillus cabrialesii TaxID=2487276 RepID=UPI003D260BF4